MDVTELKPVFDIKTVNSLIGVRESYQAPGKLMQIVMDRELREELFKRFLSVHKDVSFDWFREYFQAVQADRGEKKQDFTPQSIIDVLTRIVPTGKGYFEPAAGTGGIVVSRWWQDCLAENPLSYRPSHHLYNVEELSDAALPFLLFNLAIRGMNATVFHGDSLDRSASQVYFLQNDDDNFMGFSSINVLPHSEGVTKRFRISRWTEEPLDHIESKRAPEPVQRVLKKMKEEADARDTGRKE